ncbi:MAG: hypothetical protein ACLFUS_04200 [Candidatus Sumerlaeia bacterium]
MRIFMTVIFLAIAISMAACSGNKDVVNQPVATQKPRPEWVDREPDNSGDSMYFVGLSTPVSTEAQARDEAMAHSSRQVVRYMGEMVKTKYDRARVSFGLSSSVQDPTVSMKAFDKALAANMVEKLKAREWYVIQVNTHTGPGWKAYVLSYIPMSVVEEGYKETAQDMAAKAQKKARQESNEQAKQQYEDASDFWKKLAEEGFTDAD